MPQKTKLSTKSCVYISLIALFAALLALFATFGSISSAVLVHHLKTNSSNKAEKPYYTDAQIEQLYQLTLNDDSQSYTISKYIGEQKKDIHVVIPAKYKNLPITQLGNDLFSEEDENYDPIFEVTSLTFEKNSNVKEIGDSSFSYAKIKSLELPNSVIIIEDYVFYSCQLLEIVKMSENIEEIGKDGFFGCFELQKVVIPASIKSIEELAFAECEKLTIEMKSLTPPQLEYFGTFNNISAIYVPAESLEVYKTADGWSRYASKIHPSN